MIVNSNKPLFFAATALMCVASFYGSELVAQGSEIVVEREGPKVPAIDFAPRQLNVPPGFPAAALAASSSSLPCEAPVSGAALAAVSCKTDGGGGLQPASLAQPVDATAAIEARQDTPISKTVIAEP